uniref:RING-type domain-containing protein n=1 Tax=Megaselia scalaris TaxID=36166 RepID=T1H1U5_MEGSC
EKLLHRLEESDPEPPSSQEDECVICINAKATMQTSPCGHRVVCRRCFVKTIQSAVAQRMLPLRCVICRARINRLISNSGTWRLQESYSSYSMTSKSWSLSTSGSSSMPPSASSYSIGHQKRVAQSSSLYSMSSGSSTLSGVSSASNMSSQSNVSRGSSAISTLSSSSSSCNTNKQHNHAHGHSTCQKGCSGAILSPK